MVRFDRRQAARERSPVQADELTRKFSLIGLALSATDARGNRTALDYDGHDRPLRTYYPSPASPGVSSASDFEQFA